MLYNNQNRGRQVNVTNVTSFNLRKKLPTYIFALNIIKKVAIAFFGLRNY